MAQVPRFRSFAAEDYKDAPEWFVRFLQGINETVGGLCGALLGRLTRSENMLSKSEPFAFTTAATAANTFPLKFKNKLSPTRPTSVWLGQLARKDGGAPANAFSMSWEMTPTGEIAIRCQGLENSTAYVGVLVYEA